MAIIQVATNLYVTSAAVAYTEWFAMNGANGIGLAIANTNLSGSVSILLQVGDGVNGAYIGSGGLAGTIGTLGTFNSAAPVFFQVGDSTQAAANGLAPVRVGFPFARVGVIASSTVSLDISANLFTG